MKSPLLAQRIIVLISFLLIGAARDAAPLGERSLIETLERSLDSIVSVRAENIGLYEAPGGPSEEGGGRLGLGRSSQTGSGVIIDSAGIIVTNAHIVEGARAVTVTFHNNETSRVTDIRLSRSLDIAFLKIELAQACRAIAFSVPGSLALGSEVYTVGGSEFLKGTFSRGVIIGMGIKHLGPGSSADRVELMRINISAYQGDSGGAVVTGDGKLAGIVVGGVCRGQDGIVAVSSEAIARYYDEYSKEHPNVPAVDAR